MRCVCLFESVYVLCVCVVSVCVCPCVLSVCVISTFDIVSAERFQCYNYLPRIIFIFSPSSMQ